MVKLLELEKKIVIKAHKCIKVNTACKSTMIWKSKIKAKKKAKYFHSRTVGIDKGCKRSHTFYTFEEKAIILSLKILNPPESSRRSELLKYVNFTTVLSALCVSMVTEQCSASLPADRLFPHFKLVFAVQKGLGQSKQFLAPLESQEIGERRDVNFIFEIEKRRTQS